MKSPVSVFARFRASSANSRRPSALLRWVLAALGAIALLGSPPAVPAAQASGAAWYDGMIEYSTITNCVSIIQGDPYLEYGAGTYVGFLANPDAGLPAPNTTYYVHVVVYGLGNSCSGERVWPEISLPSNTSLAIDGTHPVYCLANGFSDPSECPQSFQAGIHGTYAIRSPDSAHGYTWPLPQGKYWEFQIPVTSTTALSGSNLTGYVNVLDGNTSPWLMPQEGVYVFGGTPTVFYPSPATRNIGTTTATSYGDIYNAYQAGNVWFELGTTTAYGLVTDGPIPLSTAYTNWEAYDDWQPVLGSSPLQPDTLYHYRVSFQATASGLWYVGADQTFRTLALGGAATLTVSGIGSGSPAGTARSVTVTAKDGVGGTATGYRGTVHFTSSDPAAVLPADHTFTAANAGVYTFSLGVILKTAGTQSVSARDTVHSSITGMQTGIVVTPAAATHLVVSGIVSPYVAGVAHSVTVTAKDAYGNTAPGYRGTIHFSSSDPAATLPANYIFAAGDAGVHKFSLGVTLKTAGTRSVTATDIVTVSITGVQSGIVVTPAAAKTLVVSGLPSPYVAGVAHSVTVTAKDAYGNTATGYRGAIHFSGSDPAATLPANYIFTAANAGSHTFSLGVTLRTPGTRGVQATDTVTATITGVQSGIVVT